MSVIINGTLLQVLPVVEGESARGHWMRGSFIIQYGEEYPRKALFSLFGEDKVRSVQSIPIGSPVQVRFCPESREFNGRYFTENRCISVLSLASVAPAPSVQPTPITPVSPTIQPTPPTIQTPPITPTIQTPPPSMPDTHDNDDLPF